MRLNAPQLKRAPAVSEQAAAWLATLSDEACTQEERRQFAYWLTRSNTHVDEFLRISILARQLERSRAWPAVDIDRLIAEARAQSNITRLNASSNELSWQPRRSWLAAAAVLLAATFGGFQASGWLHDRNTYETRLGELRSVTLADGSIVELNAKSGIRTRFDDKERNIELAGEAVFRVAQNRARPFKVSTPLADIIAVGTQFNVDSRSDKTVVTVVEGRVKVMPRSASTASLPELAAGEQAVIQRKRAIKQAARVDPAKVTAWTTRRLYFEDTPLIEAIGEFERYSTRRIRIDDPRLAERRITGTFDSFDPQALVRFLSKYGGAAVTETETGWTVSPARR